MENLRAIRALHSGRPVKYCTVELVPLEHVIEAILPDGQKKVIAEATPIGAFHAVEWVETYFGKLVAKLTGQTA